METANTEAQRTQRFTEVRDWIGTSVVLSVLCVSVLEFSGLW